MAKRYLERFEGAGGSPSSGYASFVAAGTASATDGATAPTPGNPAGLKPGDCKVCVFYSREATDGQVNIDSSLGWKELYNELSSGGLLAVWYRFHELLDPAPQFTLANLAAGDTAIAQVAAWRGVKYALPLGSVGAVASNGSQANIGAIPGITLPAFGTLIVAGGKADDWTSVAALSQSGLTFAEIGEPDSTDGNDAGLVWDYATVDDGSETAITDKTFTVTGGASAVGKGVMFALVPEDSYVFPTARYEYVASQGLRSPLTAAAGMDYAYRQRGAGPGLKAVGEERVRAVFQGTESETDEEADEARSKLTAIGRGKLWTTGDDSSRRWCWAQASQMPEMTVSYERRLLQPMLYAFERLSDWFSEDAVTGSVTIDEATEYFELTNAGNAPVKQVKVRLLSNACGGFEDPALTNLRNGYDWSHTASCLDADAELKVDGFKLTVELSEDGAASYADDSANFSQGSAQEGFMRLEPGINSMKYEDAGGCPDATLQYAYWPTWD